MDVFVVKLDGKDAFSLLFTTQWGTETDDRPGAFAVGEEWEPLRRG